MSLTAMVNVSTRPLSKPETAPTIQILCTFSSNHSATSANTPVSITTPMPSMMPMMNRICCSEPYCVALGTEWLDIWSAFINLRFITSFTTQSTESTQSAPRNGDSFVMLWKVGMNQRPPMPTNSISTRCQGLRLVSSPR